MNIVEQAASIAASTWDQDKTYEQAMLEAFYSVRGPEIVMSLQELEYWDEQAQAEKAQRLDCTPDPDGLPDEDMSDAQSYYSASRGV